MKLSATKKVLLSLSLLLLTVIPLTAQEGEAEIQTIQLADNIYMLIGGGGNLGVSVGEDGVFLIDDQLAPLTGQILAAIAELSDKPVKFVLNTHWHYDHTGGNENFGNMGSIIVAHNNVRKRMSTDQFISFFQQTIPATPKEGLPVVTFSRDISFFQNDEEIIVTHIKTAHTDGDVIILFKKANVLHTGDIYFNGVYPFIDLDAEGSVNGIIQGVEEVLNLVDDNTKIIPGHGPLSNKEELKEYRKMLITISRNISKLIKKRKTLEEIQAAKPTAEFDEKWGQGFIPPDKFVELLYTDLSSQKKPHKKYK